MSHVVFTPEQVTPEWLTAVLRRQGVLPTGRVQTVVQNANPAFNSHLLHLRATFTDDVPSDTPAKFVLKLNLKASWAISSGVREATFYGMVAELSDHPPVIVPCYDAAVDRTTGDSHVLLEDVSESHVEPFTRDQQLRRGETMPSSEHLEGVIDALARFHAFWWQHPRLGTGVAQVGAWCSDAAHFASEVERRQRAWDDLRQHEADWFPSQLTELYEALLPQLFGIWQTHTRPRLASFDRLTLTHGDAYLSNFLCPRPGQEGATYLIDWQSPEAYRGGIDLVPLCAAFWTRAQRAEIEVMLLERYYHRLQEHGVAGYAWRDLITDYQLSLIDWLLIPLQDRLDGSGRDYWLPKMQCLADAFEDWDGAALLT